MEATSSTHEFHKATGHEYRRLQRCDRRYVERVFGDTQCGCDDDSVTDVAAESANNGATLVEVATSSYAMTRYATYNVTPGLLHAPSSMIAAVAKHLHTPLRRLHCAHVLQEWVAGP